MGLRRPLRALSPLAIAAILLGALVMQAAGQGGRPIADWQRDLLHPSAEVRARAARALSAYQHHAIPPLMAALNDKEYGVRASATEALVKIGAGPVVPSMIKALDSPHVPVRANAVVVLGSFGPDAKAAVPALARALKDQNSRVRELAGEALNRIAGTGPNDPVSFLLNCH